MKDDTHNWSGVLAFVIVAVSVVLVGIIVVGAIPGDYNTSMDQVCEDEYGEGWALNAEHEVLRCEHTNGSTAEFPIETNLEQDHLALPKIAGVVAVIAIVIGWLSGIRDPNEK
mgnify:CR=1 FL=1